MKFQIYTIILAVFLYFLECHGVTKFVSHKDCNNVPKGRIVANPGNCSQYIQCNGLRSTLGECPAKTYFNPEVISCDKSRKACKTKDVNKTTEINNVVVKTTTTTTTTDSPLAPASTTTLSPPECNVWFNQQFAHPYNCEYFYYCIRGYLSVRRCYFGFGWDLNRRRCVLMEQANCYRK